jgi:hypothetical protein
VQAVWFCASALAKISNQQVNSLLEINTTVYTTCSIVSCAFWWSKPLNTNRATACSSEYLHLLGGVIAAQFSPPHSYWKLLLLHDSSQMRPTVGLHYVALMCEPGRAVVYTVASSRVLGLPILSLALFTRRHLPGSK